MSSFLVSESTMAKIAEAIAYVTNTDKCYNSEELKAALPDCLDKDGYMVQKAVAEQLFKMNDAALRARYGNSEWWLENVDCDTEYKEFVCTVNPFEREKIQLLKSLHCYLYQCCEGNVPESNLYKTLQDFEAMLTANIVYNLPEYDEAKWG